MALLRSLWLSVRETTFVVAQVITLGVVAMVLGLVALNALLHRPAAASPPVPRAEPSRPLVELVPTLIASTPTAQASGVVASPTPTIFQPPGIVTATAVASEPPPTAVVPTPTVPAPTPPPPTATPRPEPSPTSLPATPTALPNAQSQAINALAKILPADDGLPARVRSEPTTKSPILVRVPLGASVEVLGTANGDELKPGNPRWLRVRWKEVTGYVYSDLVGQ